MRRTGFARKAYEPPAAPPLRPLQRVPNYGPRHDSAPRPKDAPLRSEAYRRLVAALPCAHCGRPGPSQCAHSDSAGKGMGMKSTDLSCWPACADGPGRVGCHTLIGASGVFTRSQRAELEARYAQQTRATLHDQADKIGIAIPRSE